jgi:hypothetical protein
VNDEVTNSEKKTEQMSSQRTNEKSCQENQRRGQKTCLLSMRSEPALDDVRELETIVVTSLRALFGEWEPHGCQLKVKKDEASAEYCIECPESSVGAVRCALAMVSAPAYLAATIYRFDVIDVKGV